MFANVLARYGARTAAFLALCLILLASCGSGEITGSGTLEVQEMDLDPFSSIRVSGTFDVLVDVGENQSVRIVADDNVGDSLVVEVVDGVLAIGVDEGANIDADLSATVTLPELISAEVQDRSSLEVTGAFGPEQSYVAGGASELLISTTVGVLKVDADGQSAIQIVGEAQTLSLTANDASDVDSDVAGVQAAVVEIAGSSQVDLESAAVVAGTISGSSDLVVPGSAQLQLDIDDTSVVDSQ